MISVNYQTKDCFSSIKSLNHLFFNRQLKIFIMKKIIKTTNVPMPIGPYNQAVLAGGTLYISGQIPMNPSTGKLVTTGIKDATKQVMENLKAILAEADLSFNNVVKSSIFIEDMDDFTAINEVYGAYFEESIAPARETVQVAKLPLGVAVEISVIAVITR